MSLHVSIIMLLLLMVAEHCMYAPVCCGCWLCFDMCALLISVHCLMGWFCFPVVFLVPLAAHQNYLQLSSSFNWIVSLRRHGEKNSQKNYYENQNLSFWASFFVFALFLYLC